MRPPLLIGNKPSAGISSASNNFNDAGASNAPSTTISRMGLLIAPACRRRPSALFLSLAESLLPQGHLTASAQRFRGSMHLQQPLNLPQLAAQATLLRARYQYPSTSSRYEWKGLLGADHLLFARDE